MTVPLAGEVALGGAEFSIPRSLDDSAAVATIRAGYDAGIRIFDSARAYATVDDRLHNERLCARALAGREDATVATKGGHFSDRRDRVGHRQLAGAPQA